MPPRKSEGKADDGPGVDDYALPRTMVTRLAKGVLPPNSQIHRDAILALSRSATVFVNHLTAECNERASADNKKTIQPGHVFEALKELEFEGFLPRCQEELAKYNSIQCDKRNSYRARVKQEKQDQVKPDALQQDGSVLNGNPYSPSANPDEHRTKKLRRESASGDEDMDMGEDEGAENDDENGEDDEEEEDEEEGGDEDERNGEEKGHAEDEEADDDEDRHRPGFEEEGSGDED